MHTCYTVHALICCRFTPLLQDPERRKQLQGVLGIAVYEYEASISFGISIMNNNIANLHDNEGMHSNALLNHDVILERAHCCCIFQGRKTRHERYLDEEPNTSDEGNT